MQASIQFVDFPQPGKKFGKLKLHDGNIIWVPPNLLGQFRASPEPVEIDTTVQTWGQPPNARQVTVAASGPKQAGQGYQQAPPPPQNTPYQGNSYGQGFQAPPQAYGAQQANTGFQGRGRPDAEARMIFVTGVVGRSMGSGKFAPSDIAVLATEANRAYDVLTGAAQPQPAGPDMSSPNHPGTGNDMADDKIPF